VRAVGAGRPAAEVVDPGLAPALDDLVAPETRGDPTSALRWTTKSTSHLADELSKAGHEVSAFQATGDPVISVDAKKKEPAPRGALPYSQSSWEEFGGSIPGSNG